MCTNNLYSGNYENTPIFDPHIFSNKSSCFLGSEILGHLAQGLAFEVAPHLFLEQFELCLKTCYVQVSFKWLIM